jgi:hypothetical protein
VLNLELDRTLLLNRSLIILSRRRARSLPGSDESAAASVPPDRQLVGQWPGLEARPP